MVVGSTPTVAIGVMVADLKCMDSVIAQACMDGVKRKRCVGKKYNTSTITSPENCFKYFLFQIKRMSIRSMHDYQWFGGQPPAF
jgi:hypothetical protein